MRVTAVLNLPPKFHFWKDFGAGKKRRIPFYKHWYNNWRRVIARKRIIDYTLSIEQLPPGSRLMNAEDFMEGHIDALPEELIRAKQEKVVYDHPWPYNVQLDPIKDQEPKHCYNIGTRFFSPRDDCQVLTNTLLETDQMEADPPIEPSDEHIHTVERQYHWATKGDSVLVRQPNSRVYPVINLRPTAKYGITKERQEVGVLDSMFEFSQTLIAQHHHQQQNKEELERILHIRSVALPHCRAPFTRDDRGIDLDLCIESMSLDSSAPLPQINLNPGDTSSKKPIDIKPRSWKSLLEQSKRYTPNWSFTLPRESHLHTILLASRIKRDYRNEDEMLARSIIHAFGLTSQYARLKAHQRELVDSSEVGQSSIVLQDPLSVSERHDEDLLKQPIVLQTIGFELPKGNFHFMRYQLNTTRFNDNHEGRVKNQAWYSGPIGDLREALRYYLDFQAFNSAAAVRMRSFMTNQRKLVNEGAAVSKSA